MAVFDTLLTFVLLVLIASYILRKLAIKFDLKDKSYRTAVELSTLYYFFTGILSYLFGNGTSFVGIVVAIIILLFVVLFGVYILVYMYEIEYKKALKIWAIWFGLSLAAGFIIGLVASIIRSVF